VELDNDERFLNGLLAPTIFVVAHPTVDWSAVEAFEKQEAMWRRASDVTDADNLVELAGRVCYLSFGTRQSPRTNLEYVANLINHGHESVLEHAAWTLILTGVTRAFTHQLVRHRVGFSYSQLSQQYHTEEDARFIEPSSISRNAERQRKWRDAVVQAHRAYLAFIDDEHANRSAFENLTEREFQRASRSAARTLLPAAIETKIVVSANARAIRHFLSQRGAIEGDEEMRVVSARLLEHLRTDAPALFADFRIDTMADGSPIVRQKGH
jgi:thymidylate synthase (FAD)